MMAYFSCRDPRRGVEGGGGLLSIKNDGENGRFVLI